MAHTIRSYHPQTQLPASEAELAGLYRSVLDGKRVLLLIDNAASREQVEPLIPPSGSLLLVTSRFHFALPGLVSRDLDELPLEDARNLLLKIAPRIGKEADALAGLCGRLPLALRLAGSALAERPDLSPTDYARRLREGKERFGPVDASLIVSYDLLNKDRRRLWRLLAVFPGTFAVPAAAAVWELEADPASEALGKLVRSSLVEWEEKDERYRLHDLARSFADRQLAKTEREAARSRHAEYFLELLWGAADLYLKEVNRSAGPCGFSMPSGAMFRPGSPGPRIALRRTKPPRESATITRMQECISYTCGSIHGNRSVGESTPLLRRENERTAVARVSI
jgi:hypothetical protein